MTGGGLLVLIAYGSQNVILSGNPQMTYYYKLFKRYSHFSMENITIAMDGPNELQYDQTIQLRAKIQRYGDLMSDMYFSFSIPDIYSKYFVPDNTVAGGRVSQWEFKWVRYIGAAIINRAAFFIGGQKIQEFDGTYLLSKAILEYDTDTFNKWKILVGDVNELINPSAGAYSGGTSKTGYPSVIQDTRRKAAGASQLNRPSILGQDIHIPLNFWFTDATSQALPIIGLQYQDCEVQLTLNPIKQLYTILDASGYRVSPDYSMVSSVANIENNIPSYGVTQDVSGQIRYFLTDVGYNPPATNTWFLNPRLQCTFVYLTDDERQTFAGRPLTYVFPQVYAIPYNGIIQRNTYDLDIHNPITRLIFVPRRSDWIYRNDYSNFTNWYTYPFVPYRQTPDAPAYLQASLISGLLVSNSQKDILRQVRILSDGNEIQEVKTIDFFSKITPYRYTSGFTNGELPIYTWALTSSKIQPSGSFNSSRVRNLQMELDVFPLPAGTTYTYSLNLYVESLNFLVIASGSGAPKYVL
jgi:Major capsid protein N-terminus/Large eukaryotic DNA virus major capsid protein